MNNPFALIDARLSNIETLLLDIKHQPTLTKLQAPASRIEAARHLGISLPTLDTLIRTKQIKSFNIGRQVRIDWDELERYGKGGQL